LVGEPASLHVPRRLVGGTSPAADNSDQYCGHRVIADERLDLIIGLGRLIDLPLNRLAGAGYSKPFAMEALARRINDLIG
jgi:hypothetical protein